MTHRWPLGVEAKDGAKHLKMYGVTPPNKQIRSPQGQQYQGREI